MEEARPPAEQADYGDLRDRLLASGPNGHELDSPWSTYAQDALTCIDAALVASSLSAEEFRDVWIEFAVEPMVASLNARGYDVWHEPVPAGGSPLQVELDNVVEFLTEAAVRLSRSDEVTSSDYAELIREAAVIRPPFDR
ncbi:hypothetical protein [Micromonospora rubida]|uniref:hypothetical protein n=1 Tax=Micromonospora rubida TaxID=2697657 RepID=UPI0013782110|nr:hypothetical protein [Micromonospora rubida]NBE81699.1 hypothetical protein [Micromonospora rubida]